MTFDKLLQDGHASSSPILARSIYKNRQRSGMRVDAVVLIACCLLTVLGLAKAAVSEQPFLWLALWPAPVVIASTVFTFLRQGFHFQDGVLILGRRQG